MGFGLVHYIGGKHRQGKIIAEKLRMVLYGKTWYCEPFCGSLSVAYRVDHCNMFLCDVSYALITMWQELQDPDLELPDEITPLEYLELKRLRNPHDWMTAYVGFGMSFGAIYFGAYARDKRGDVGSNLGCARRVKTSTNKKRKTNVMTAVIECFSYDEMPIPENSVIYCDPPYENTSTKAHDCSDFDSKKFWQWCREKVKEGHRILITEFIYPDDFVVVHSFGNTVSVLGASDNTKPKQVDEVLVCHETQGHLWQIWDYEDKMNGTEKTRW